MRIRQDVSAEKLRGGFYSPPELVDVCLRRVKTLTRGRDGLTLLEPTAGDGEFIRGLGRSEFGGRVASVDAVELIGSEAAACEAALKDLPSQGRVTTGSFLTWALLQQPSYDVAVGNPPFVRFQFVTPQDRNAADELGSREGIAFGGVSNLWIPVLLGALRLLKPGGAFAFIIPTECFTGVSAGVARAWLLKNCRSLRADLFAPGSFPGVLQEVLVLSGTRSAGLRSGSVLEICEHPAIGRSRAWSNSLPASTDNWTPCLLEPAGQEALAEMRQSEFVFPLRDIAKFEVAAVTGANAFFSVDRDTVERYELDAWAVPLLPRIRRACGLRYTSEDHEEVVNSGAKAFLLDFSAARPDPRRSPGPAAYLGHGVAQGLPDRYKCRIREPWFRVPHIRRGLLMMSKRSHRYPRVVVNEAGVFTTDTIYRGNVVAPPLLTPADVAASFHNSLTLLTAELEGRSFGGGVLELVPSEIARLSLPVVPGFGEELARLDGVLRDYGDSETDALVEETDLLLRKSMPRSVRDSWDLVGQARRALLRRRLDRSDLA